MPARQVLRRALEEMLLVEGLTGALKHDHPKVTGGDRRNSPILLQLLAEAVVAN
jgi:hypothetical protein